jgi:hypothetical protein
MKKLLQTPPLSYATSKTALKYAAIIDLFEKANIDQNNVDEELDNETTVTNPMHDESNA